MAEIKVATFEQIATVLSQLITNYSNLAVNYYNIFYNPVPSDIKIQLYDDKGVLRDYVIPNRAKDFRFVVNGKGSPEGTISALVGTTYQDTLNGKLFLKQLGEGNKGWVEIATNEEFERGEGNPNGVLERPKGTMYVDTLNALVYIKTTDEGNTGWTLISADVTLKANIDLDNLSVAGKAVLNAKENIDNKVTEITDLSSDVQYPSAKAVNKVATDIKASVKENKDELGVVKGDITSIRNNIREVQENVDKKQDKLTPGTGIEILPDGTINNTQKSAEWGKIEGTISNQVDLKAELDKKAASVNYENGLITLLNEGGDVISRVTMSPASKGSLGLVKPDGTTVTVDPDGTLHSVGGSGVDFNIKDLNGISNCVTEIPQGALEETDVSVIVRKGTKFMIADGLNADKTAKAFEVEYTGADVVISKDSLVSSLGNTDGRGLTYLVFKVPKGQIPKQIDQVVATTVNSNTVWEENYKPDVIFKGTWFNRNENTRYISDGFGNLIPFKETSESEGLDSYATCPIISYRVKYGQIESLILSTPVRVAKQQELLSVLDYCSEKSDKNLKKVMDEISHLSKDTIPQITNCALSIPEGSIVLDEPNKGVKILDGILINIPAGLVSDKVLRTRKGTTSVASGEYTFYYDGLADGNYLAFFKTSDPSASETGSIELIQSYTVDEKYYYNQEVEPELPPNTVDYAFWFSTSENEYYISELGEPWTKAITESEAGTEYVSPFLFKIQIKDGQVTLRVTDTAQVVTQVDLNNRLKNFNPDNAGKGGGMVVGSFVPFMTSENWIPEGFLPVNGSEYASDGIFSELWTNYLTSNKEVREPIEIPVFTSNTGNGYTIADSRNNTDAYTIFNGVKSKAIGKWNTYWYKLECPTSNYCSYYTITASSNGSVDYPSSWKLQGSNNGTQWTDIETVHSQVFKAGETRSFVVNSDIKYKQYLITFLSGVESAGDGLIGKIHFYLNNDSTILDTCTYTEYEEMLASKGACPKWAVDEALGKFRVPTIPEGYFVEQGSGTVYKAGLPNITGELGQNTQSSDSTGCIKSTKLDSGTLNYDNNPSAGCRNYSFEIDASKSNSIYGSSNTVQPKSVGLRWFVYVSNAHVNESAVDWSKIISEVNKLGKGIELTDIGIAPFGINEAENLRRYLNGQVILQEQFKAFTNKIKGRVSSNPNLFCTNEEFEAELTMSAKGQCGKFVIDDVAGTIRLPKVINIQGLFDLQNAGLRVEAGLPNIKGTFSRVAWRDNHFVSAGNTETTGAFKQFRRSADGGSLVSNAIDTNSNHMDGAELDASLSSPIYGNSATVQEEAIQYPYFIQVATGATEKDSVINEYQLNNPYSLLDCKWSDHKLTNISWLLSDGQLKSGTTYKAVYDLLLKEYNSSTDITEELFGVSITYRKGKETGLRITTDKTAYNSLLSKTGTAWFYVLDTVQTGFYLPQTNGMLQFGGTGEFVEAGLPNITGKVGVGPAFGGGGAFYYKNEEKAKWGLATGDSPYEYLDASKSNSIYGKSTTVQPNTVKGYLYFYAGETVENANLIDAGKMQGQLIIKADKTEVAHLSMPSDRFDDLVLGASGTTYTAPADGYYAIQNLVNANGYITFQVIKSSKMLYSVITQHTGGNSLLAPVTKGATLKVFYQNTAGAKDNFFRFIYAEGSSK